MYSLSFVEVLLAVLIVALGTAVQAAIGFGLAMIAAPLLLLIDPALVPGPVIFTALVLSLWVAWLDRGAIDLRHFKAALAGRLVGTPPAALLLGSVSAASFDLLFGSLVLLAVALSIWRWKIQPAPASVFLATAASGFMGTISAIGGPPIVLVYQNASGPHLRANLAVLFVTGTIVSLLSLALVGRFGTRELLLGLFLLLGVGPGILAGKPLKRHLDRGAARPWLLGLCALSALAVLLRAWQSLSSADLP